MGAFWQPRMGPPKPVFYSLHDPLCNTACLHKLLASWQRVWETSQYGPPVSHPPLAPPEYLSALSTFLGRLGLPRAWL